MQELTAYKAKVEAAEGGASEPEKTNSRLHYRTRLADAQSFVIIKRFSGSIYSVLG